MNFSKFLFSRFCTQCFLLIFLMDPLERLCSVYQHGRPLEEYIHEFLICSKQTSLDQWTLVDCFRGGLDEGIAQWMPLAGSRWTLSAQAPVHSREMAPAPDQSPLQAPAPDQSPLQAPAPDQSPVQAPALDQSQVMSPEVLSTGTILVGLVCLVLSCLLGFFRSRLLLLSWPWRPFPSRLLLLLPRWKRFLSSPLRGPLSPRSAQGGLLVSCLAQRGPQIPSLAQRGLMFPSLAHGGLLIPR